MNYGFVHSPKLIDPIPLTRFIFHGTAYLL